MQHQIYFGRKFYLDKKNGYWISTDCPRIRAHVWVWINNFGEIEKGMHIHHIDENKSNNDISNLRKITVRHHISQHMTPEKIERAKEWIGTIRPLTKEWHASEEGIKWHSNHAKKTLCRKNPVRQECAQCGNAYTVDSLDEKRSKFCSNKCKSARRRDSGIDDVNIQCNRCSKIFKRNKYAKTRFCSRTCAVNRNKNKIDQET